MTNGQAEGRHAPLSFSLSSLLTSYRPYDLTGVTRLSDGVSRRCVSQSAARSVANRDCSSAASFLENASPALEQRARSSIASACGCKRGLRRYVDRRSSCLPLLFSKYAFLPLRSSLLHRRGTRSHVRARSLVGRADSQYEWWLRNKRRRLPEWQQRPAVATECVLKVSAIRC